MVVKYNCLLILFLSDFMSQRFAVIDTETNWNDEVMSIGIMIANSDNFKRIDSRYYILSQEASIGGMFSSTMYSTSHEIIEGSKSNIINDLKHCLNSNNINDLFAYNASFDKNHLPELSNFCWHDIMKIAAYKQYNKHIPKEVPCCSTGRMKRGYGVEPMLNILGVDNYFETHNAVIDARDELLIMKILDYDIDSYPEI